MTSADKHLVVLRLLVCALINQVHIYRRQPGAGLTAGKVIETILEGFGIADATAKSYGKRNPYSVVRATFNALLEHESIQEVRCC